MEKEKRAIQSQMAKQALKQPLTRYLVSPGKPGIGDLSS